MQIRELEIAAGVRGKGEAALPKRDEAAGEDGLTAECTYGRRPSTEEDMYVHG